MKPSPCRTSEGAEQRWHGPYGSPAHRTRFFRRLAFILFFLVLLGIWGAVSLILLTFDKTMRSPTTPPGWLPVAALAVAFLVALAFLRIFRRVGVPFRDVMDAASRVAEGDYGFRVPERGPPAVRGLAHSFNTMTDRLQKNEQQRRNLLADVAHELRTPLSVVQGKIEGLLDGVYPRDDLQLSEVLSEVELLSRLIEDLRTLALSEAGSLRLQKESTDMRELLHSAARAFEDDANAKNVSIAVAAPVGLPLVFLDPVRIRQVLNNLLSNALRHTPSGGRITTSAQAEDRAAISVEVRDTGSGMTQTEIDQAFERFQKGPDSRGSGLGLTIARNLVLAHGGEMEARSQPGVGTTIRFTLPLDQLGAR